jgi:hypothetical protein
MYQQHMQLFLNVSNLTGTIFVMHLVLHSLYIDFHPSIYIYVSDIVIYEEYILAM